MSQDKTTKKELLQAIEKLEKNPHDRIRILGELGIAGIGAGAAGAAAAILGSTSIAVPVVTALTGFTVVAAAPVALVAGATVAGAAATYGLAKLAFGGAFQEGKRSEIKKNLIARLKEIEAKERQDELGEIDKTNFMVFLKEPIQSNFITTEQAESLMQLVESGRMEIQEAYNHLYSLISEEEATPEKDKS
ncbi:hypothetical protein ACQ4N7_28350 [Nodosilinea sp. AN01ver1]|uniref:hypothetical protein n=1 Tax=Nodosilinea sp. AN01ver1 TaxID=3423362 RepID=UPI003D321F3F